MSNNNKNDGYDDETLLIPAGEEGSWVSTFSGEKDKEIISSEADQIVTAITFTLTNFH